MSIIFLAYANSRDNPLPSLQAEDNSVYDIIARNQQDKWHIHRDAYATTRSLTDYLLLYQQQIEFFSFSGHAEGPALIMEDDAVQAAGVAALLGSCPNLKAVLLNGCSTQGQVEGLLAAGVPLVIATSAPVEDRAASEFAIGFFRALCEYKKKIGVAFEDGLAVAKTSSKNPITASRGRVKSNTPKAQATWGIFHKEGYEYTLDWGFSTQNTHKSAESGVFKPNELLIEEIWKALEPFQNNEKVKSRTDKIERIITDLPHPISEYLRKLISKARPGEDEVFYNELGNDRLRYLTYAYTTCIELLAFTMVAQLWDELASKRIPADENLQKTLLPLFTLSMQDRKLFNFWTLINGIKTVFDAHKIEPFISEYGKLTELYQQNEQFQTALNFIEKIKNEVVEKETLAADRASDLCIKMEENLAKLIPKLGFLAKYGMSSMKGIEFIKYKHQTTPNFKHHFVELKYKAHMDIDFEVSTQAMDNASVVLIKEEKGKMLYLNLSPFIFDPNSYDPTAKLADLGVFQSFEKLAKAFTFRFIYKPDASPLIVAQHVSYFKDLTDQFNAFHELVYQKPILDHE